MDLSHRFTIPVPVEQAWAVLLDVERIAPCMPGATLESSEGDVHRGRVKVKVGPITVTYRGTAEFTEKDEDNRQAVIRASGKEARGSGTANATVTTRLTDRGEETDVTVDTNLAITGKPAQFGRNVMGEVAQKLLDQFADCLAGGLAGTTREAAAPAATAAVAPAVEEEPESEVEAAGPPVTPRLEPVAPAAARPSAEAIDLLDVAGGPLARRLLPAALGLALLLVVVWLIRRRG
jgi:uncharacterized protein